MRAVTRLLGVVVLFACVAMVAAAQETVVLKYGTFGDIAEANIRREQIAAFEAAHPHIKVEFYHGPDDNRLEHLLTLWAAGESWDLLYLNEWMTTDIILQNMMLPLNELMERDGVRVEDFHPALIEACSHNGVIYCLPQEISPIVVYYNVDWFNRLGVPRVSDDWTFEEFREIAKRVAHGDGPSRRYAYVNWFWWGAFMPFIYSNGGEVFTRDRRAQFSSPEVVDALQFLIDLVHVDQVAVNPHAYEGPWFLEEGYAMYSAGVWDLPGYRYTHPPSFEWDIALHPANVRQQTIAATLNYGISAQTKHPEEAWELLKFLTATEAGQYPVAAMGMALPSYRSPALISEFVDAAQGVPANVEAFLKAAEQTRLDLFGPRYREFDSLIWTAVNKAVHQEATVEAAMEELDRILNALLEQ